MPDYVRNQFLIDIYVKMLQNNSFFSEKFSCEFLKELAVNFEERMINS